MKIIDSFKIVWRNLWRMKVRTILTSIGVTIGTAAIISMISLSIGLKQNAVSSLENFGNLTELEVHPASFIGNDPRSGQIIPPDQRKKMNWDAVYELQEAPHISAVMPTKRVNSRVEMKYGRLEGYVQIMGVDVRQAANFKGDDIEKGEFLSGARHEIIVAYDVPAQLRDVEKEKREQRRRRMEQNRGGGGPSFSTGPPMGPGRNGPGNSFDMVDLVGKTVTLVVTRTHRVDDELTVQRKEVKVRVVGRLMKGDNGRLGNVSYVPLGLLEDLTWEDSSNSRGPVFMGMGMAVPGGSRSAVRSRDRSEDDEVIFDNIFAKVDSREHVQEAVEQLQSIGFDTWSPARQLEEINKLFMVIQLILGGIAAISLLVATIGIINTMIMSILERTREIGIMKVIGATVFNIRWLFLIESGAIGLIGGLTGLGLASGAVGLINTIARSNPSFNLFGGGGPPGQQAMQHIAVIPIWLALFAIGFSFIIGLLAGIYPAFRASRLSPLQAIRSE